MAIRVTRAAHTYWCDLCGNEFPADMMQTLYWESKPGADLRGADVCSRCVVDKPLNYLYRLLFPETVGRPQAEPRAADEVPRGEPERDELAERYERSPAEHEYAQQQRVLNGAVDRAD